MLPKKRLDIDYLRGLAEHSMCTQTFATGEDFPDKPTIRQFCRELAEEMSYQYDCDVRDGLVDGQVRRLMKLRGEKLP